MSLTKVIIDNLGADVVNIQFIIVVVMGDFGGAEFDLWSAWMMVVCSGLDGIIAKRFAIAKKRCTRSLEAGQVFNRVEI